MRKFGAGELIGTAVASLLVGAGATAFACRHNTEQHLQLSYGAQTLAFATLQTRMLRLMRDEGCDRAIETQRRLVNDAANRLDVYAPDGSEASRAPSVVAAREAIRNALDDSENKSSVKN